MAEWQDRTIRQMEIWQTIGGYGRIAEKQQDFTVMSEWEFLGQEGIELVELQENCRIVGLLWNDGGVKFQCIEIKYNYRVIVGLQGFGLNLRLW